MPDSKSANGLTADQARAAHAALAAEIAGHDQRYHQEDAPIVSDAAYDALRRKLMSLEALHPELKPATEIGAAPASRFAKVRHAVPMLSLDNCFTDEDAADFVERVRRFLNLAEPPAFTAEPKIDGLSCAIRYEGGKLV
ncbi:MAG: NAD-dependent DNA ligase LigA, partial [Beijerinckiaceae bacterium]